MKRKPRSDRKEAGASTRRGVTIQFERELMARVDQAKGDWSRTGWIRRVIERALQQQ